MVYSNPLDTTQLKTMVSLTVSLTVLNTTQTVVLFRYLSTDLEILLLIVVRVLGTVSEGGGAHAIELWEGTWLSHAQKGGFLKRLVRGEQARLCTALTGHSPRDSMAAKR